MVMVLTAALAACTSGRPGPASRPGAAGRAGARGKQSLAGGRPFIIAGGGLHALGGAGPVVAGGPGGGGTVFFAVPPAGLAAPGLSGVGTRPQITLPPVPPAGSAPPIAMPLDSYEQVASQEQETLAAADDLLTQRCMQAKGFSYPVTAQAGSGAALVQSVEDGGYGLTSLAQAQTYGYGQPSQGQGQGQGQGQVPGGAGPVGPALPGFVHEMQQHGTAWTSALLGFVPGARASGPQRQGCYQVAELELYGPINGNPDPDPVPGLAIQAAQWTQSDRRVLALEREWSRCMAGHGFTEATPIQPTQRNWPATPTPVEITTAEADVSCKKTTNLVNTWLTVEAAYQQALVAQNLTALSDLQANFGALLRRAEALLEVPVP